MEKNERPEINPKDIMTAEEVASLLKVSVGAVRRWTRDGLLLGHKIGGRGDWRYLRDNVTSFLFGDSN